MPVLGVGSSSPLTSTVGVTSRTGLPMFCGTCRLRRCGFCDGPGSAASTVPGDTADAGVGGNRKTGSGPGEPVCARSTIGVRLPDCLCTFIGVPSRPLGFTGKVTKGPSLTERLLGGRPRNFPLDEALLLDQADETAGPCRRRARGFALELALEGVMAD
jgi:hypothetical protein